MPDHLMNLRSALTKTWMISLLVVILVGCAHPVAQAAIPAAPSPIPTETPAIQLANPEPITASSTAPIPTNPAAAVSTQTFTPTTAASETAFTDTVTATIPTLPAALDLDPANWKDWPVIPTITQHARQIYQAGILNGTDPHAFSVLGDCQSLPETFMGVYDLDPSVVNSLPDDLQATVSQFGGSFSRPGPTVKGGTTAGAILWIEWHEGLYGCQMTETPLACELRIHNPSIVLINLGTHYETRNIDYLRKILDILISQGSLPVLSTKADDRELDDRLNYEMAQLAVEYNLPLWNFWNAVSDLPNNGVGLKKGEEFLGEIYLSDEGLERQRFTALQVLDTVWRAVK